MLSRIKSRYENTLSALPELNLRPAAALRESLAEGYTLQKLRGDVLAGIVVGVVALPLSMALAIASGVPPQHGLYTAVIAGFLSAALGGSKTLVSGPTAAFVVILAPISHQYGTGGLLVATMMAGLMMIGLGLARMGQLIQFIPHPVTTGFTTGIGVVIAILQLKDVLGLQIEEMPEHTMQKLVAMAHALPTMNPADLGLATLTLVTLIYWPRITTKVPSPIVALALASVVARVFHLDVATIGSRFSYVVDGQTFPGIPRMPPTPLLPWSLPGADGGAFALDFETVRTLFPAAFAIATLGAIESLLSAVVSDGMAGTKHDPDAELVAQGTSNLIAPFFGGFASTGAIARTATNIRAGGKTPIAAMVHAVFVLAAVVLLAPVLGYLPMSALAGLLLMVAYNMSELKHFTHIARVAPKSDVSVLLVCFGLTVVFDMTISVSAGMVLAAFLFMRRMAEISGSKMVVGPHPGLREPLPRGVALYEIAGPLFFGAAQKAMSQMHAIDEHHRIVILEMGGVPAMDATGLVALESALDRLRNDGMFVILASVQAQPAKVFEKAGITDSEHIAMASSLSTAVARAKAKLGTLQSR